MKFSKILVSLSTILGGILLLPVAVQAVGISPTIVDDIMVDPGGTIQFEFRVLNDSDKEKTFYFSTQNFRAAPGEQGKQEFIEEELDYSADLANWIVVMKDSAVIPARGESKVNVVVNIPTNAEPGGHYGVIWAGESSPDGGGTVSITGNVGLLVLVNVSGDVTEGATVEEFNFLDKFQSRLPVEFFSRIKNEGSVYFKPRGDVVIKGIFGNEVSRIDANPKQSNVLPDSIRRIDEIMWEKTPGMPKASQGFFKEIKKEWKNFGFGPYKANLELQYGSEGNILEAETVYFWVVPWHLLLVAVLILVLAFVLLKGYNKMIIKVAKKKIDNQEKDEKEENDN